MPDKQQDPQLATFKDAFCAYYRCRPEAFERKAFWKTLYRHAVPLAIPIWLFNRRFFHSDLEVVRQFGRCRDSGEFSTVTGEFATSNRLERSIRRGFLRIRVSGTRLLALHNRLIRYIAPHEGPIISDFVAKGPAGNPGQTRHSDPPVAHLERSAATVRKLHQAHDAITSGHSVPEVLRTLELSESVLLRALEVNVELSPRFAWLLDYLQREGRLAHLEAENARLLRELAHQSTEIQRLRESNTGSAPIPPGVG